MPQEERGAGQIGYSDKDFKVCDLCGALNRAGNIECFVCGWSGFFNRQQEVVRQAMREFEERYGGLSEAILAEELLPDEPPRPGLLSTLVDRIKHFLIGRETA